MAKPHKDRTPFEVAMMQKPQHLRTEEEKRMLFGDAITSKLEISNNYERELVRRFKAGEYLSRADAKEAKRLMK